MLFLSFCGKIGHVFATFFTGRVKQSLGEIYHGLCVSQEFCEHEARTRNLDLALYLAQFLEALQATGRCR